MPGTPPKGRNQAAPPIRTEGERGNTTRRKGTKAAPREGGNQGCILPLCCGVMLLGFLLLWVVFLFQSAFRWCCLPSLLWVVLCSPSVLMGGTAWFPPFSGVAGTGTYGRGPSRDQIFFLFFLVFFLVFSSLFFLDFLVFLLFLLFLLIQKLFNNCNRHFWMSMADPVGLAFGQAQK